MEEGKTINDFVRNTKIITVKDSMLLDALMNHFIQQKVHIALIYNDYGTFTGVATLEDVIEEIIKVEIVDEADLVENMQHFATQQNKITLLDS